MTCTGADAATGATLPRCSTILLHRRTGDVERDMTGRGAVLVTGSTGSVGRYVVEGLAAAGEPVRAARRTATAADDDADRAGIDTVAFDFADPSTYEPALDGVDRIFLMRPPALSDVKTYLRPVVELAARRGVRHVVFLSLLGVNRAVPHWQVEQDLRASGLSWTFLRAGFFMQNLETAYGESIRDHDRMRIPAGRGRTSFTDTRDVAALALRLPDAHTRQAYDLTGPAALDYGYVASVLSAELGRPIHYQPVGLARHYRELLAAGRDSTYANVQLVINLVARAGFAGRVTDTVPRPLGRPAGTLEQYVHDHRDVWMR